jgi:cobaltochelatase CobS
MEFSDLCGGLTLNALGGMEYAKGPLLVAMEAGHILMLDEVDLLPPAVAMGLNSSLDGAPFFITQTGETIQHHPDFRIVVTGNTAGSGDASGLHRGTVRQNLAWVDRFMTMYVGYLEAALEEKLLQKRVPSLPAELIPMMVKVANEVRTLFMGQANDTLGETLDVTLSSRTLATWGTLAAALKKSATGSPIEEALRISLLNRASPAVALAIDGIALRVMGNLYRIP